MCEVQLIKQIRSSMEKKYRSNRLFSHIVPVVQNIINLNNTVDVKRNVEVHICKVDAGLICGKNNVVT